MPRRTNIGQILETHLGWSGQRLEGRRAVPDWAARLPDELLEAQPNAIVSTPVRSTAPREAELRLRRARRPTATVTCWSTPTARAMLFDGAWRAVPVPGHGYYMYIMKLHQIWWTIRSTPVYRVTDDRSSSWAVAAQFGGQRFGEMEGVMVAYGAACHLQELLTIKSDDVGHSRCTRRSSRVRTSRSRASLSRSSRCCSKNCSRCAPQRRGAIE